MVARVCVCVQGGAGGAGGEARPSISMPGSSRPRAPIYDYDDDRPPSAEVTSRSSLYHPFLRSGDVFAKNLNDQFSNHGVTP